MKPVFNGDNDFIGLWVQSEADAGNHITIGTWSMMTGASSEVVEDALAGKYRVVPNRYDSKGGFFCMFGDEHAPGENVAAPSGASKSAGCMVAVLLYVALGMGICAIAARVL